MSDLRPHGVKCEIGGQERTLLFTINVIDKIQSRCNLALYDAMEYMANAAGGTMDHETLSNYKKIVFSLIENQVDDGTSEDAVGDMIDLGNYKKVARSVLDSFGISLPDPDENEAEEDGDDPNVETGQ